MSACRVGRVRHLGHVHARDTFYTVSLSGDPQRAIAYSTQPPFFVFVWRSFVLHLLICLFNFLFALCRVAIDREDRLRMIKDRQNEERQRKLEELKAQAAAAQKYREQKEEERRRRIEDMRVRELDRKQQVEERKRAIQDAEKDRRDYILRKNQVGGIKCVWSLAYITDTMHSFRFIQQPGTRLSHRNEAPQRAQLYSVCVRFVDAASARSGRRGHNVEQFTVGASKVETT